MLIHRPVQSILGCPSDVAQFEAGGESRRRKTSPATASYSILMTYFIKIGTAPYERVDSIVG
jgi:hypothetical protein